MGLCVYQLAGRSKGKKESIKKESVLKVRFGSNTFYLITFKSSSFSSLFSHLISAHSVIYNLLKPVLLLVLMFSTHLLSLFPTYQHSPLHLLPSFPFSSITNSLPSPSTGSPFHPSPNAAVPRVTFIPGVILWETLIIKTP